MKFIFEVKMKPGFTMEEYAEGWTKASAIMQRTAGARGTFLHRDLNDPTRALAIAHWESKAARDKKDDSQSKVVREILVKHGKHCEITVIGEFAEPEWQVIPGTNP